MTRVRIGWPWRALAAALCVGSCSSVSADDDVERIEVVGDRFQDRLVVDSQQQPPKPDVAAWLRDMAGADVNRNGPVSGIAQYRGLYGDRVNVSVGGRPAIGAGPNAMDAPLSYAPTILTRSLSVHRGIAPVSAGMDTLGGAVEAAFYTPEFDTTAGAAKAGYRDNGSASEFAGRLNMAQQEHALLLYGEDLYGRENIEDGDDREISPSGYHKRVGGGSYRYRLQQGDVGASYQYLDTKDAGTPALPMDIDYIRTHSGALSSRWQLADWRWALTLGFIDADHVMDNYRLRSKPDPAGHRKNTTTNDSVDWQLQGTTDWAGGELSLGLDGYRAEHDAVITNPNNPMFEVVNFNSVEDNRYGAFAEWLGDVGNWELLSGARIKYIEADAGRVAHSMAMMNPNLAALVQAFNSADRDQDDINLDLVFNATYRFSTEMKGVVSVAHKQRSASYQERYLWLPMQATGGLADGRTYVGDIELDPEQAWQLDLGLDWQSNGWLISPRVHYQRIDDYIQGAPSQDPTVRMVGMMMGDGEPLQFSNLDAEIYGADIIWSLQLSDSIQLGGQGSYVRGKRRDINDNLYRIAPPNTSVYLSHSLRAWTARVIWRLYAEQDKVSATNREQETAGYGVVDLSLAYQLTDDWAIRGGVDNLLDHAYQDHLAGYNRVMDSDLAMGERLAGAGRTLWLTTEYVF